MTTVDDTFNALKYRTFDAKLKAYIWHNEAGQIHREDGPAVEYNDGDKEWFYHGLKHRTDGPAIEYADGSKAWFINGKPHRTDGPAVEYNDGIVAWYVDGEYLTEAEFNIKCNSARQNISSTA